MEIRQPQTVLKAISPAKHCFWRRNRTEPDYSTTNIIRDIAL